jgi:hypothetical protein
LNVSSTVNVLLLFLLGPAEVPMMSPNGSIPPIHVPPGYISQVQHLMDLPTHCVQYYCSNKVYVEPSQTYYMSSFSYSSAKLASFLWDHMAHPWFCHLECRESRQRGCQAVRRQVGLNI